MTRDPQSLRIHHSLAHHPRWADEDPRLMALTRSLMDVGVLEPLKVTEGGEIVDGRHRWLAAKRAQLTEVPVSIVADDQVATIVLTSLLNRRHFSPGQSAYLAAEFMEAGAIEAVKRRSANLNRGTRPGAKPPQTQESFAAELGVSLPTLERAIALRRAFDEHPEQRTLTDQEGVTVKNVTFREFYEPRIFQELKPYGIGACLAGIGFILSQERKGHHTGGKPKNGDRQLGLFNELIDQELARWTYWQGFDTDARQAHLTTVSARFAGLDTDKLTGLAEYHATLARLATKACKAKDHKLEDL